MLPKHCKTHLQALKLSQKGCMSFWKHKIEAHTQNDHKRDTQKRECHRWTTLHECLHDHLVSWRNHVACGMRNEIHGFILPVISSVPIACECL